MRVSTPAEGPGRPLLTFFGVAAKVCFMACPQDNRHSSIAIRSYQGTDRIWVEDANVRFYRAFHDFDSTFADAVSAALDLLEGQMSDARSLYLIAESGRQPVGCIFLSAETSTVSRIRLFYLEEAYRGRGTGKRLLSAVVTAAREKAFETVRVSTFDRHPEACRLYESFGFEAVSTARSKAFGKDMRQVDYELLLVGGAL